MVSDITVKTRMTLKSTRAANGYVKALATAIGVHVARLPEPVEPSVPLPSPG